MKKAPAPYQPGTPADVHIAAALATRLHKRISVESIRYVAKRAGLGPRTIINILNGTTWPDLRTIAKLEIALNGRLWETNTAKPGDNTIADP